MYTLYVQIFVLHSVRYTCCYPFNQLFDYIFYMNGHEINSNMETNTNDEYGRIFKFVLILTLLCLEWTGKISFR